MIDWEARTKRELKLRHHQERRAALANKELAKLRTQLRQAEIEARRYKLKYEQSLAKELQVAKERLALIADIAMPLISSVS